MGQKDGKVSVSEHKMRQMKDDEMLEDYIRDHALDEDEMPVCFTLEDYHRLPHIVSFLNLRDRDLLLLMHVLDCKQSDVAEMIDIKQPLVSYDCKMLKKRLKFAYYLNGNFDLYITWLRERSHLYDGEVIGILTLMYYTTSLQMTAEMLCILEAKVRYYFKKTLKELLVNDETIYPLFKKISENFNLIRRCKFGESFISRTKRLEKLDKKRRKAIKKEKMRLEKKKKAIQGKKRKAKSIKVK